MFEFCEPPDVGNPRKFLAAVTGIFEEYPIEVMEIVSDPVRGLPSRVDRPKLRQVRDACDEAYAPIWREKERQRIAREAAELLALPAPPSRPKHTPEEIAALLGRSLKRIEPARVERTDGNHAARALADLALRAGRAE